MGRPTPAERWRWPRDAEFLMTHEAAERFAYAFETGAATRFFAPNGETLNIERDGEELTVCARGPRGGLRAGVTTTAEDARGWGFLEQFDEFREELAEAVASA